MTGKETKELRQHARQVLEKWLPVGSTVYTIRLCSRDTAQGRVYYSNLFAIVDGRLENITGLAARLTSWRTSRNKSRCEVMTRSSGPDSVVVGLSQELFGASGHLNAVEM